MRNEEWAKQTKVNYKHKLKNKAPSEASKRSRDTSLVRVKG